MTKLRAAVAEKLLLAFINRALPVDVKGFVVDEHEAFQFTVAISPEMMRNLRMYRRAHAAHFKGAAAGVLEGMTI